MKKYLIFTFAVSFIVGCYYDNETDLYDTKPCDNSVITYNGRIKNIMSQYCTNCHGGNSPSYSISLTTYNEVKSSDNSGKWLCSIMQNGDCINMPQGGKLSDCDIEACNLWVKAGYPEN